MTDSEIFVQVAQNTQAVVEVLSFVAGLLCALITAITWKG